MKVLFGLIYLLLFYNICGYYSNITGIEICGLYQNYNSNYGNYGTLGVPSSSNFPGSRYYTQGTFSKTTNTLWIFGGKGYSSVGKISTVNLWFRYW
jgi:hypothetical protein